MPRYEYQCPSCSAEKTIWHSMTDDSEKPCDECPANLERTISKSLWVERFQTQAVLTNGQRIDGHFGRVARTNKNKWG